MADLEADTLESAGEGQAVSARFNPWWIVAIALLVLGVALGLRGVRGPKTKPPDIGEISV